MSQHTAVDDVADRLHSAAIHLLRRVRKEDEASGLSPARLSALSVVVFGGPVTVGQLAAAEQVRSPTMSRLVAELQAAGLVRRVPSRADGRAVEVRATAQGRRVLLAARRRRVASISAMLAGLDQAELSALDRASAVLGRVLSR